MSPAGIRRAARPGGNAPPGTQDDNARRIVHNAMWPRSHDAVRRQCRLGGSAEANVARALRLRVKGWRDLIHHGAGLRWMGMPKTN